MDSFIEFHVANRKIMFLKEFTEAKNKLPSNDLQLIMPIKIAINSNMLVLNGTDFQVELYDMFIETCAHCKFWEM